jgi:hypothetical protein
MLMVLDRLDQGPERTIGELRDQMGRKHFTLEPGPAREKGPIPAGMYRITLRMSPHLGYVTPWLRDVPGFDWVLIHIGNKAPDTKACVLVGMTRTANTIESSRTAFDEIMPAITEAVQQEGCWVDVRDTFKLQAKRAEVQ